MNAPSPTIAMQWSSGAPSLPPTTAPTPNPIGPMFSALWYFRGGSTTMLLSDQPTQLPASMNTCPDVISSWMTLTSAAGWIGAASDWRPLGSANGVVSLIDLFH